MAKVGRPVGSKKSNAGRKTRYNAELHVPKAREFMAKGSTRAGIAQAFNIGLSTLYEWIEKYPELADALKEGEQIADDAVVSSLYRLTQWRENLDGETIPPNMTSIIFWLKNRDTKNWRDRKDIDAEIKVSDLSEEELNRKIQELIHASD